MVRKASLGAGRCVSSHRRMVTVSGLGGMRELKWRRSAVEGISGAEACNTRGWTKLLCLGR